MPVEMIGWVAPQVSSEILDPQGPVFCPDTVARTAKLHEDAGFDRVLVGYFTHAPDGFIIATHAATATERLSFLIAHRPGFVSPTLAARKFATLDQLTRGRVAVHIISGGSDADQAKDGDYAAHADRYRRSAEYIEVLKKAWMEPGSFDHHGDFYRVDGAYSQIGCFQDPRIPVYGGGGSDSAVAELSPHIDVFMLWGEPLDATSEFMQRVRQAASATQNPITFSLSTRPILADTEGKAWDKARDIFKRIQARLPNGAPTPQNVGSQRLLDAAAAADIHDSCLFMELATAAGARGNSTALVGTPDTVANAMLRYYQLGATSLLIRGYDPVPDTVQYGQELIPKVRELIAAEDAELPG